MKYIIHGQPIPLQRPRFVNGHIWDCQSGEKMAIGTNLRFQHKSDFLEGPLHVDLKFFMKHARKQGWHNARPDIDNLIKFYLDVMNAIIYSDDSQVVKITSEKVYDKEPRTEITIEEL